VCQVGRYPAPADKLRSSSTSDAYSNTNEVEDYTQVGVLSLFEIVTPGGLDVSYEISLWLIRTFS